MTIRQNMDFHRVKCLDLPFLNIEDQFAWTHLLADGNSSKVVSAKHKGSQSVLTLKFFQKQATNMNQFFKEYHYNYFLSPHPNIINSFNAVFQTEKAYVYAQELAPEGDLSLYLKECGLGQIKSKRVVRQICSALEFMHSKDLVHGEINSENILVFQRDMTQVKLADFGLTSRVGTRTIKTKDLVPWEPPEVCQTKLNSGYHINTSTDSWQLGILIFVCLTGSYPWFSADETDPLYTAWVAWQCHKTKRLPQQFKCLTSELLRLMTKLLEPEPEKRANISVVKNCLCDPWLIDDFGYFDLDSLDNCTDDDINFNKSGLQELIALLRHVKI